MAVYGNISSKTVIAKLYRDLYLEDSNYDLDFLEWMGEALSFIGAGTQLEHYEQELTVEDFKADLPPRLVSALQVKYREVDSEPWTLMGYNPSTFKPHDDEFENFIVRSEETFSFYPNIIHTTLQTGFLKIAYKGIAVDAKGYPLLPDNQYFKDALFWYCYRQMVLRGYKSRVEEINYFFADEKWKFYCTAAKNKANFPDISRYQRFKDIWTGLLPAVNLDKNGFDDRQSKQLGIEIVNAGNLITRPLTTKPEDPVDPVDPPEPTAPSISNPELTITEL